MVVEYINGIHGATKERKRLRDGVRACEFILQQLKDDADDTEEGKVWSETIKALEGADAPLGRLWVALNIVKAKLEPKTGLEKALTSLKWPFNEKDKISELVKDAGLVVDRAGLDHGPIGIAIVVVVGVLGSLLAEAFVFLES